MGLAHTLTGRGDEAALPGPQLKPREPESYSQKKVLSQSFLTCFLSYSLSHATETGLTHTRFPQGLTQQVDRLALK